MNIVRKNVTDPLVYISNIKFIFYLDKKYIYELIYIQMLCFFIWKNVMVFLVNNRVKPNRKSQIRTLNWPEPETIRDKSDPQLKH